MAMHVAAIVQARMGSTRLPGKVLKDIAGHTMLERAVVRVRRADGVHEVVVATTMLSEDDRIVSHCHELGVAVGRGDPLDILSRYAVVARETGADVIVRVTADCPFVDGALVSTIVASLVDSNGAVDYAANTIEPRTYPRPRCRGVHRRRPLRGRPCRPRSEFPRARYAFHPAIRQILALCDQAR